MTEDGGTEMLPFSEEDKIYIPSYSSTLTFRHKLYIIVLSLNVHDSEFKYFPSKWLIAKLFPK